MKHIIPKCKYCDVVMLVGRTENRGTPARWISGIPPAMKIFGIVVHGNARMCIHTYRCEECGYLESFAPDVS